MKRNDERPWYEKAAGKKARPSANRQFEKNVQGEKSEKEGKLEKNEKKGASSTAHLIKNHSAKKSVTKPAHKNSREFERRKLKIKRSAMFDGNAIPKESLEIINHFDDVSASVLGLSGKQRVQLGGTIKKLSHELTDDRGSRRLGYMNDASSISAYISYFMWWNLVRLSRLFSNLPKNAFDLPEEAVAVDIGSGPLTVPVALWLSRPELRSKKITWYCVDFSQGALSAGEEIYLSVAAKTLKDGEEPWKIVRVKGPLGTKIKEKADFVVSANTFNEIIQNNEMPTDFLAKKYSGELTDYLKDEGGLSLLIEPGDPHSARFVSLMRDAFIRRGFMPVSPCPHCRECPMDGRTGGKTTNLEGHSSKWCNFAFNTEDAPLSLLKLSEKAGLSKDRASLSFVLSRKSVGEEQKNTVGEIKSLDEVISENSKKQQTLDLRIASDFIKLPELHRSGYYACSEIGLVLAVDEHHVQPKNGELLTVPFPTESLATDKKSGAAILHI